MHFVRNYIYFVYIQYMNSIARSSLLMVSSEKLSWRPWSDLKKSGVPTKINEFVRDDGILERFVDDDGRSSSGHGHIARHLNQPLQPLTDKQSAMEEDWEFCPKILAMVCMYMYKACRFTSISVSIYLYLYLYRAIYLSVYLSSC